MLKKILILIIMVASFANIACKKCSNITTYKFPAATERYFGVYKQGNWWVYKNQDSTKKDSIYLTDVDNSNGKDRAIDECVEWDRRTAKVHSSYLSSSQEEIKINYEARFNGAHFNIYQAIPTSATHVVYQDGVFKSTNAAEIPLFYQNGRVFTNIIKLKYSPIYYSPNVGIIRWETGVDTFTLKSYYIQ